jgi:hypothetical protein
MGWQNYHPHMFRIAGQIFGNPEHNEFGDIGTLSEKCYCLNQLSLREKTKISNSK